MSLIGMSLLSTSCACDTQDVLGGLLHGGEGTSGQLVRIDHDINAVGASSFSECC